MDRLDLGKLSFYWRHVKANELDLPSSIPAFLPFVFAFDSDLQLIIQESHAEVLNYLEKVYLQDQNIGYMQADHELAKKYGGELLAFVNQCLKIHHIEFPHVLDIGCGGCYILNALKQQGCSVYGIDPSPMALRFGKKFDIPIVVGFYPLEPTQRNDFGNRKMDIILSSGLFEHVPDPGAVLAAMFNDLQPDGWLIICVPDSEQSIALGDISILMHEHLSYFDEESLSRLVSSQGFDVLAMERAGYGASLYCCARRSANPKPALAMERSDKFLRFCEKASQNIVKVGQVITTILQDRNNSLGFYVPLRALPYLSTLKLKSHRGIRFFDDDPGVYQTCFDGFFDIPVENFSDLKKQPVSHMLVMSLPHADVIEKKIKTVFGNEIEVIKLETVLCS